jgi:hypothetical protein
MRPRVTMRGSIIITSYNYARYLRETIESALAQTHSDTEVIVVDDGSTDESPAVIAEYGDRVRPILKDNGGQGSAFNAGVAVSTGEIVLFLDSDDLVLPDALARAADEFADPAVVKVNWPLWIVDGESRRTGAVLPSPERLPDGDLAPVVLESGPYYDWDITPPTSGNVWSRRFLDSVFPMPEPPYRVCADEYLLALAPIYGTVRKIDEPLSCYRAHGGNHGWQRPLDDAKIADDLQRFEVSARILAEHVTRLGGDADLDGWLQRNFNYTWMKRLQRARADLRAATPAGATIVVVDEFDLGQSQLEDRTVVSALFAFGEYEEHPANDEEALAWLERVRELHDAHLAFWWTAFWWFDRYPRLLAHLSATAEELVSGDHVRLFRLRR